MKAVSLIAAVIAALISSGAFAGTVAQAKVQADGTFVQIGPVTVSSTNDFVNSNYI